MEYYLLTNPKFTRRQDIIIVRYANNPGDGIKGGRVNYPTLNPHKEISLGDLKALNVRAEMIGGNPLDGLWDPLDFFIGQVQQKFNFYFRRRFGQRYKSDEDKGEDEKIEEEIFSSDEDEESVKENAD